MNFKNICYFCLSHIYNMKKLFIVSIISILISLIIISKLLVIYNISSYDIKTAKNILGDTESLYKIEFSYINQNFEYAIDTYEFIEDIKSKYNATTYDYTSARFSELENNQDFWAQNPLPIESGREDLKSVSKILYADKNLFENYNLKDINGDKISLIPDSDTNKIVIGYNYKDIIPVGTILTSIESKRTYIVSQVLSPHSEWLNSSVLNLLSSSVNLDDYFITTPDSYYGQGGYVYGVFSYIYNVYVNIDDEDLKQVYEGIEQIADNHNVVITIKQFDNYVNEKINDNKNLYTLNIVLCIILTIISLTIIVVISIVSWISDMHDIGVLYANGFLSKDIFKIIVLENSIRFIIPLFISYTYILVSTNSIMNKVFYIPIFAEILVAGLVSVLIASYFSYKSIKSNSPVVLFKGEE